LRLHRNKIPDRIADLGKNLFQVFVVDETISCLEAFFKSIGSPVRLSEMGINAAEKGEEILQTLISNHAGGNYHKLNESDYRELIRFMA
jgi:alcohol dehydrogenase YqhD (iron-dependent ADH family)